MNPGKRMPSKISVVFMRSLMLMLGVGLEVKESVIQGPSSSQQAQISLLFHH